MDLSPVPSALTTRVSSGGTHGEPSALQAPPKPASPGRPKARLRPSGDHRGFVAGTPGAARTMVPSGPCTISSPPLTNAMRPPAGENRAVVATEKLVVSATRLVPSALTAQMVLPQSNAIRAPSGDQLMLPLTPAP